MKSTKDKLSKAQQKELLQMFNELKALNKKIESYEMVKTGVGAWQKDHLNPTTKHYLKEILTLI